MDACRSATCAEALRLSCVRDLAKPARALAHDRRRAPCPSSPTPPCRADPSTETRGGASAASARDSARAARSRRRSRPGNPTMMSDPIEACGMRRADAVDQRGVVLDRVRPPHRRQHTVARVLQRQVEVRREARVRRRRASTISGVQSIGSSELIRNSTGSAGHRTVEQAASARSRLDQRRQPASRSRPYEPRWTPVSAISLKPAAATRSTSPQHVLERHAARPPARRRNDAVGARLGAAGLHAQRERGATGDTRLDRGAAAAVAVAEALGGRREGRDARSRARLESAAACRRSARPRTTFGKRADFVRAPRGVAAGDDDAAPGLSRAMRRMVCRAP